MALRVLPEAEIASLINELKQSLDPNALSMHVTESGRQLFAITSAGR